jgi:hypothetical protein
LYIVEPYCLPQIQEINHRRLPDATDRYLDRFVHAEIYSAKGNPKDKLAGLTVVSSNAE